MASATAHSKGPFTAGYGANSSHLIERRKLNVARRSTPDSEALASSDDEVDQHTQSLSMHSVFNSVAPKPVRRSSWLSDVQNAHPRKVSFSGASFSSNNSQPSTPSGEQGPWSGGPTVSRTATTNSVPWSPQIWGSDTRKEPPSRLTEVLQSPTSAMSARDDEDQENGSREYRGDSSIPFQIPLEPNRKQYRSQSYSVGQTEADAALNNSGNPTYNRSRGSGMSSVKGRRSRLSMLGEFSIDSSGLGQVREDEDDDESSNGSHHGVALSSPNLKNDFSHDASSNLLQKQAVTGNPRSRPHHMMAPAARSNGSLKSAFIPGTPISDSAIDEGDDVVFDHAAQSGSNNPHGLSLARKAQWQSSLGFGSVGDGGQSRRHSFADVPSWSGFAHAFNDERTDDESLTSNLNHPSSGPYMDMSTPTVYRPFDEPPRNGIVSASGPPVAHSNFLPNPYAPPSVFARPAQQLHIVSFKCARSDVYYIPEGTGLEVKRGDMVIVDGDRGMDLGTVTHANVTMAEAKQLKEEAAKKHFEWLMMFSRTAQITKSTTDGLLAASGAGAVGGMRPSSSHQGSSLHNENEIRPKMIKRLAQNHEIQMLRDKEGSEAKAKRVCSGKVTEHGLNMEILDAEFQLDWKKLTFFYYAETYINFNDLVQDLFKIYKTRIWMSAINPASFATTPGVPPHLQSVMPPNQAVSSVSAPIPRTAFQATKGPDQDGQASATDVLRSSPFASGYAFQPTQIPFGYSRPPGQPSPVPQVYPLGNPQALSSTDRLAQPLGDPNLMRLAFMGRTFPMQPTPVTAQSPYMVRTEPNDPWHRVPAPIYDGLPRDFANLGLS